MGAHACASQKLCNWTDTLQLDSLLSESVQEPIRFQNFVIVMINGVRLAIISPVSKVSFLIVFFETVSGRKHSRKVSKNRSTTFISKES